MIIPYISVYDHLNYIKYLTPMPGEMLKLELNLPTISRELSFHSVTRVWIFFAEVELHKVSVLAKSWKVDLSMIISMPLDLEIWTSFSNTHLEAVILWVSFLEKEKSMPEGLCLRTTNFYIFFTSVIVIFIWCFRFHETSQTRHH